MIDHLMYKNFLKNTTNVITNEQKSKKFEKQFSRWLYIFMKEKTVNSVKCMTTAPAHDAYSPILQA